jgi:hypothetical protein
VKPNGIGSHTMPNNGQSETWLTPPEIIGALGRFDLDPCAAPSPRPWPTAAVHIELPTDGLAIPWVGRVFCNPPYGDKLGDWLEKMGRHRCGIALTFARTETDAWQRWVWPFAHAVLFISGRLYFRLPDGTRAPGNAGGPSALVAYSDYDVVALLRSGIPGAVVRVERAMPASISIIQHSFSFAEAVAS